MFRLEWRDGVREALEGVLLAALGEGGMEVLDVVEVEDHRQAVCRQCQDIMEATDTPSSSSSAKKRLVRLYKHGSHCPDVLRHTPRLHGVECLPSNRSSPSFYPRIRDNRSHLLSARRLP